MVEGTTGGDPNNNVPPQTASDIVGPVTLTGGLATCKCDM